MGEMVRLAQGGGHLSGDVALQATDDFLLAHPFGSAAAHVSLGSFIVAQPDDDNTVEGRVGLAVTAAVEAMAVGFTRGGGNRIDATQGGEGSLRAEALGVAASSYQQGGRRVGSYTEASHQVWGYDAGEPLELRLQVLDFLFQLMVAASQGAKGVFARRGRTVQKARFRRFLSATSMVIT